MSVEFTEYTPTMLEVIKVSKRYPPAIKALSDVSISIAVGEMFFLTGMSGAGKTTLLKLICNQEQPSQGLIEVDGKNIHTLKGRKLALLRQKIGVAYQDFKLLTDRTVAENIAIAMEVSYKKPQFIHERVQDLLARLQLTDKHDKITGELSRGEQQRVTLARSVANSPSLILVDEPTGNLDGSTTEQVMNLLARINHGGATVVIATHDESILRNTNHRIMELRQGRVHSLRGGVQR